MTADALSQDEIDALLKGAGAKEGEESTSTASAVAEFPAEQIEAISRYSEKMAATHADTVGTFLGAEATVTAQNPEKLTGPKAAELVTGPVILVSFSYQTGLLGSTALVFRSEDVLKIGGTMTGDPEAAEFSEMVADAFKEVMSTVVGNLNTSLGSSVGGPLGNSEIQLDPAEASAETLAGAIGGGDEFVVVPYTIKIGEIVDSECWQLIGPELAESMLALTAPPPAAAEPAPSGAGGAPIAAAPAEFDSLTSDIPAHGGPGNLDLIMDIGLEVRVELGRSNQKIRDVLKLGTGSVIELDKLAGEPVDLLVNDVIFARGEVVVIDENFGVRITEILSLQDRIKKLGERKDT